MSGWLEIAVTVPRDASDAVANRLLELGAPGIVEEEVAGAPSVVLLRAHFPEGEERAAAAVRSFLVDVDPLFPGCAAAALAVSRIAAEDWAEGWKSGFPPLDVGRRLRVRAPWTPPVDDGRLEIEILPAMAFGTGQHASTLGCLLALDELAEAGADLSSVLDVGTGSGLLAIAAVRFGARRVVAVDDDPLAVEAAVENVRRNGVTGAVEVSESTAAGISGRFTLILANLYANLLRGLFPAFARVAAPGASLVAAGLLDEDRRAVSASAAAAGWRESSGRSIEGWTTLVFGNGG